MVSRLERGAQDRLSVLENKVFRNIFGAKRYEITGERRKLHNAEVHTLYSSPDIITNLKWRRVSPPLWVMRQHARLSRSEPGFNPRSGQVSWVRFFGVFPHLSDECQGALSPQGPRISFGHHNHPSIISLRAPMILDVDAPLNPHIHTHTHGSH